MVRRIARRASENVASIYWLGMLDAGHCSSPNVGFARPVRRSHALGWSHGPRGCDRAGQLARPGLVRGDVLLARLSLLHRAGLGGALWLSLKERTGYRRNARSRRGFGRDDGRYRRPLF